MTQHYFVPCFFCGRAATERHHVFQGAYRKKSEQFGFVILLCHDCHNEPPNGVHQNKERRNQLKRMYQSEYEKSFSREDFIQDFGRSYL